LSSPSRPAPLRVFGEDFLRFLEPGVDRLEALQGMLARRGLSGRILAIAGRRHLLVKKGGGRPRVVLVAHYDRVEGSPGALDNSAACLVLANVAQRVQGSPDTGGTFILFTDGEEAPATEGPLAQGAYALGLGLKAILGEAVPAILVLDVVGRGSRLLLSSASRGMLDRTGEDRLLPDLVRLEAELRAAAERAGLAEPLSLPLPWSDDLGFVLAGLPAIEATLLPEGEARLYSRAMTRSARPLSSRGFGAAWPRTWSLLHGREDEIGLLDAEALATIEGFCLEFCGGHRGGGIGAAASL